MREILFKAKRMDNGGWVYGYYVKRDNMAVIYPEKTEIISKSLAKELRPNHPVKSTQKKIREIFPVDPSTVCQYTGLEDMNGVKIFEGDLCLHCDEKYVVHYDEDEGMFVIEGDIVCINFGTIYPKEIEIVGNIHDSETPNTPNQKK